MSNQPDAAASGTFRLGGDLTINRLGSVKHLEENTAAASLHLSEAEWKEIEKAAK